MPTFVRQTCQNTECFDEDETFPLEQDPAHAGLGYLLRENALLISGFGLVLLAVCMAVSAV
ncbi:MAG: hypothetical protein K5905_00050 [Roseibium sp.]|uniref:hypothetical protein n=1 Tax=Roseibium sp. TaxID=1936156 RepID=UPI00260F8980|nr:hypothetical protein [Roseibium sp.]MCV0423840.1 hypothetical protein [Roseibium sp.]